MSLWRFAVNHFFCCQSFFTEPKTYFYKIWLRPHRLFVKWAYGGMLNNSITCLTSFDCQLLSHDKSHGWQLVVFNFAILWYPASLRTRRSVRHDHIIVHLDNIYFIFNSVIQLNTCRCHILPDIFSWLSVCSNPGAYGIGYFVSFIDIISK